MKAKRKTNNKLIVSFFLFATIALAAVAAIVTVLALTNKTVNSAISLSFIAEDIEGKVTAEYKVSSEANWTKIGDWDFMAKDNQQTKVMDPGAIELNAGDSVEFRYTFRNYGDVDYTGILALDEPTADSNVVVQYKYNSNEYSSNHYGLVVEGLSGAPTSKIKTDNGKQYTEMTYYIQFAAANQGKNGEYNSNFIWDLKEYVAAPGEEVISLASTTFVQNAGTNTYSAQYNGGDISVSGAAASGVSAQDVTIQNVWYVPSKFGSASVTTVKKGNDFPANTKVVLSDAVTTIEDRTFSNVYQDDYGRFVGNENTSLVEVVLGNGITEIPNNCFAKCSLLRKVNIPTSVTTIGGYAFAHCTSLKEITIPSSVTTIRGNFDGGAFYNCTGVEVLNYNAGDTVYCGSASEIFKDLGKNATRTVVNINSATVPAYLFYGCEYIDEINIGSNVISVGMEAFSGCDGLKEITIPNNVTTIDVAAFNTVNI